MKLYFSYYENSSPANIANNGVIKSYKINSRINIKKTKNARYLSREIYDHNQYRDNAWKDGLEPFPSYSYRSDIGPCENYTEVDLSLLLIRFTIEMYADGNIRVADLVGPPIGFNETKSAFEQYVVNKDPYKGLFSDSLKCPDNRLFASGECKIGWYISSAKRDTTLPNGTSQPNIQYSGKGYLGASVSPVTQDIAEALNMRAVVGELIHNMQVGGPAERAGLRSGDVIYMVDGNTVNPAVGSSLPGMISNYDAGTKVQLGIVRQGVGATTVEVVLGNRP